MAIGQKLGKVFGAVGSGLSFIPGPWSAVGVALSAAGSTATAVGEAKDRREAEREREQETNEVTQTPTEQPDTSRPQDAAAQDPAQPQSAAKGVPIKQNTGIQGAGTYQSQISDEIARAIIGDTGSLYG